MTEASKPERRKDRAYPGEPDGLWSRLGFHFHRKRRKRVTKQIIKHLGESRSTSELTRRGRMLLRFLRRHSKEFSQLPVVGYEEIGSAIGQLAAGADCIVQAPAEPRRTPRSTENRFPPIFARSFHNVESAPSSSALVVGDCIGVPEFYTEHPNAIISDLRFLLWQSADGNGVISRSPVVHHKEGVSLFGSGAFNWYHWLLEVLPAAMLSRNLGDGIAKLPLVIPEAIAELPTFRESLELFRDGREIVTLAAGNHVFERLVLLDSIVREPMNMRPGHWPDVQDYAYNPTLLKGYRDEILSQLAVSIGRREERIFLARGGERRSYNQEVLLAIAERYGFRAVYPERLSFAQQVETLHAAAFVVGPSGAAFANTLFCQPGTRLLSWLVAEYSGFCSYANIACLNGAHLRYIHAIPDREIKSSFDAFVANYLIEPERFEAALQDALTAQDY